ncbi:DUF898 domain-containing protein [Chitinophaga agrisoli]|uniref:DUF898 domain-containing protein n=1 Tax=Chitinophaga agrisoli TaxID=2607653 RepID=A0A5B2VVY5_9BACT|nr:YjgN family protein [Chitinophaga agrisoli]KAA2243265.1 DUF898 domain-containing protein [Chitinophaga agrisoli]
MQQEYGPSGNPINRPVISFKGDGGTYFGILIVNMLLTIITLGLYYPWAKAKRLQYLYSSTEMEGSRFEWSGTGNEMFKGFIIVVAAIVGYYILAFAIGALGLTGPVSGTLIALTYVFIVFLLIPYAIHGANRYHWSRTSWRAIRFGYRGDRTEFIKLWAKELLLTLITAGIYGSWMTMNIRNYLLRNLRFGSGEFFYDGDGWEYFKLNLKGCILTVLTLGIYSFWWQADIFRYYIDNIRLTSKDNKVLECRSTATGGELAGLLIVNMLMLVFTFGIAYAWIQIRTIEFVMNHVEIRGDLELRELRQTEEEYRNSTGENLADMLDLSII